MDKLKIDVLCSDGSPLGVTLKDIYGEGSRGVGVGGSEYALLTVCEWLTKRGHDVHIYNNPTSDGSPISHHPVHEFDPQDDRDALITFRSPNPRSVISKGKKIWWSCDQYTIGDFGTFAPLMDEIVVISPFHSEYFKNKYRINRTTIIDIPVRACDYDTQDVERIPNRLIFTSVPDRGLLLLFPIWTLVKKEIKDASLVITSDYRLWGVDARNQKFRNLWASEGDVQFLGAVPRKQLVQEEMKADILSYPCTYDELFCVSVAEAQYAGAYPVTSTIGALATTNMGMKIPNSPSDRFFSKIFADKIIELLKNRELLESEREKVIKKAKKRFHPDKIIDTWERICRE